MHTPLYAKLFVPMMSSTGEYEDLFLSYVAPYFEYQIAYEIKFCNSFIPSGRFFGLTFSVGAEKSRLVSSFLLSDWIYHLGILTWKIDRCILVL